MGPHPGGAAAGAAAGGGAAGAAQTAPRPPQADLPGATVPQHAGSPPFTILLALTSAAVSPAAQSQVEKWQSLTLTEGRGCSQGTSRLPPHPAEAVNFDLP